MTGEEMMELGLTMSFQGPLDALYGTYLSGAGTEYIGLQLPTGEVVDQILLILVGPALLKRTEEILQDENSGLILVSAEVERQVAATLMCLAVEVRTGETSAQYYALSECRLIPKKN